MKKIGVISDTHSYLDNKIYTVFNEVDEIWHAGDIGSLKVLESLQKFKPTRAVFGNIDDAQIRLATASELFFEIENCTVYINHYGGSPNKYDPRVIDKLNSLKPNLFICGHSHILRVQRDANKNNMLFVNPGAAGIHGFHKMKTCVRFTIDNSIIKNFEVVELGLRSKLNTTL
ncbi:MAG: metallophosphoesterase family protein [Bacteroidota bacterium]